MSLPRPARPVQPSGRVTPEQLQTDQAAEQEALDFLHTADVNLTFQNQQLAALQTELGGLITDSTGTVIPDLMKACNALVDAIAAGQSPAAILRLWRTACSEATAAGLSCAGIGRQLNDIDDQQEAVDLAEQDVRAANNAVNTANNRVNNDLNNLNLTPPSP